MEHIQTEFIAANPEKSNQPQIHFPTRNKKIEATPHWKKKMKQPHIQKQKSSHKYIRTHYAHLSQLLKSSIKSYQTNNNESFQTNNNKK